jgi:uncharacterized protein
MSSTQGPQDVSPLMNVLRERWVLTLATLPAGELVPYATPLFYAVAELAGPHLVFASDPLSAHGRHLGDGPTGVAAGLYLESDSVAELRGVQLRGEVRPLGPADGALRAAYLERHAGAAAMLSRPGARERLYGLAVAWAKLTDNRRGFGYKLEWWFQLPARADEDPSPPRV